MNVWQGTLWRLWCRGQNLPPEPVPLSTDQEADRWSRWREIRYLCLPSTHLLVVVVNLSVGAQPPSKPIRHWITSFQIRFSTVRYHQRFSSSSAVIRLMAFLIFRFLSSGIVFPSCLKYVHFLDHQICCPERTVRKLSQHLVHVVDCRFCFHVYQPP